MLNQKNLEYCVDKKIIALPINNGFHIVSPQKSLTKKIIF